MSHLLQMRGLKPKYNEATCWCNGRIFYRCVDWNILSSTNVGRTNVASFTDAWIETWINMSVALILSSRIFYRCVDWNVVLRPLLSLVRVASFTDAWIETSCWRCESYHGYVASFTDAWIETWVKSTLIPSPSVASFTDAWIETEQQWRAFDAYQRRIFYRCVDWNPNMGINEDDAFSRIFYRCVDWNNSKKSASVIRIGRIFYRCVDWNRNMFYNI